MIKLVGRGKRTKEKKIEGEKDMMERK